MSTVNMTRIIAICGKKRSGKDTIAKYIEEKYKYKNVKFSQYLKSMCSDLFGFSYDQIENDSKDVLVDEYNKTPREIMQFIGTELMQLELQKFVPSVGRSIWAKTLLNKHTEERIVISDLRFLHEFNEIKKHDCNAVIIKVTNDMINSTDNHISEKEIDDICYDFEVKNNSTIDDMYERIDHIMSLI